MFNNRYSNAATLIQVSVATAEKNFIQNHWIYNSKTSKRK